VEDSPAGIDAARGAGLKVLAVTNSYPPDALSRAHRVVASLAEVTLGDVEKIAT
jgi:beta-phosphoglucomutase-like phosphatase (HAD superfamily)